MLNSDQQKSLQFIKTWWFSDHQCMVLDGKGGCGKTYLVGQVIKTLPNNKPLLVTPTHEALKQIKDKVPSVDKDFFKTAHSALGIAPIEDGKDIKFEQLTLPSIWNNINLVVADEASMYQEYVRKLLVETKTKVLFVGHKSQLPPVHKNRKIFDKCLSPVFEQEYPTTTLTIPQRNKGKLWDFCNVLDEQIYIDRKTIIPNDYDISKNDLKDFVHNSGKDSIFTGETKIVLWTNYGVDSYNKKFRSVVFGDKAEENKYLPGDKIILTKPYVSIHMLEKHKETSLQKLTGNKDLEFFFSNAKAVVLSCEQKIIKLNENLTIPIYKINVDCEGEITCFYEPVYSADHDRISVYYEHLAWSFKDRKRKAQAYRQRNFIRNCFAHIKHYYAATAHRLQGASIEKIILIASDMEKNPNMTERKKCIYVGASRAINDLMIYKGL